MIPVHPAGIQNAAELSQAFVTNPNWIGFDLDGTLHDMGRVQTLTEADLFNDISQHSNHDPVVLKQAYRDANRDNLNIDIFANGWDSNRHRTLRLQAMLEHLGISDNSRMERWLHVYRQGYERHLQLFPGVISMLETLKTDDFQIAVITERPHDSAEHALEYLGLNPFVDLLVTIGGEQISKPDGLFERALRKMQPGNHPVPLIGDKLDRDIRPALAAGMQPLWYVHPSDMPQSLPDDLINHVTLVNNHHEIPDAVRR